MPTSTTPSTPPPPSTNATGLPDTHLSWHHDRDSPAESGGQGATGPALPEGEDVQAIVAVHTAMQLGLAILAKHLYRRLGADEPDPSVVARIGRARLFLAVERMIHEGVEADIRKGLDRYQQAVERAE